MVYYLYKLKENTMLELIISFIIGVILLNFVIGWYNTKIEREDIHLTEEDDY